MKEYYFDNSATSSPKPKQVYEAVQEAISNFNANPGRAGHRKAIDLNRKIYEVREKIAKFFNLKNPLNVAFTSNATESLNFAIKGAIKENTHIITTYFEHNSVLRPLFSLRDEKNVKISFIKTVDELEEKITENSSAVIINHISNINGTIQDIKKVGEICKKYNLLFILDGSQSAGYRDIDMERDNIDILCVTGHKSLFGIQGVGAICVKNPEVITPILEGGTGSFSKLERQPLEMPEKLESGTLNTPGIFSLGAGIDFINSVGINEINRKENELIKYFIEKISKIEDIKIYGSFTDEQAPVVSITIEGVESEEIGQILDEEFNILVRSGFHCAPLAHKIIGTYSGGTVRFSFGYFNTKKEIDYIEKCLKEIINYKNK